MGSIHIDRGRVGEERGGKEMDRCPLTEKQKTGHPKLPQSSDGMEV
jgi:hypothetical protein